ncbi:hypothetical protein HK097_004463, partial [Rhizophlyctis rosea]
ADKAKLLRDLESARDLCLSLERARDDFQKRCSALALELEQMQTVLGKLDTEREGLVAALGAEKLKCERLEHLIAVERTRKIQIERGVLDVQQAKGNLEAQLRALNEQQAITIQSLGDELKVAKDEGRSLRSRVENLEGRVREGQHSLLRAEGRCKELQRAVNELGEQNESKKRILEEIVNENKGSTTESQSSGQTDLEKRVLEELLTTQKQLRKYETRIENHKSHSQGRRTSPERRTRRKISVSGTESDVGSSIVVGESERDGLDGLTRSTVRSERRSITPTLRRPKSRQSEPEETEGSPAPGDTTSAGVSTSTSRRGSEVEGREQHGSGSKGLRRVSPKRGGTSPKEPKDKEKNEKKGKKVGEEELRESERVLDVLVELGDVGI